jgi:DNA-binding NtrC family response regulator
LSAQQLLDKDPYFDVVLCDLMMPNVTGMDLFLWVQKQHPQLCARFVFVSGGGFTTRARDFLHKLDNLCIEKPVDVDKLRQGIRQVLLPARD